MICHLLLIMLKPRKLIPQTIILTKPQKFEQAKMPFTILVWTFRRYTGRIEILYISKCWSDLPFRTFSTSGPAFIIPEVKYLSVCASPKAVHSPLTLNVQRTRAMTTSYHTINTRSTEIVDHTSLTDMASWNKTVIFMKAMP